MQNYEHKKPQYLFINGEQTNVKAFHAETFWERLSGLIPIQELAQDSTLVFTGSCQQMHSCFMRYPIDLIFLDENDKVLHIQNLKTWRFSSFQPKAKRVVEGASGLLVNLKIQIGQCVEIKTC